MNGRTETGEQQWLIDQLAMLIKRAGWERFVSGRLVTTKPSWFPVEPESEAHGVGELAARMLALAGVDAPHVRIFDDTATAVSSTLTVEMPDLEFQGADDGHGFEFRLASTGEGEDLLGALGHEVGRAWMQWRARSSEHSVAYRTSEAPPDGTDEDFERAAGSIAAVYLGFGVPSCNAAHRARHGGYMGGTLAVTEWAVLSAGGLSPTAMAYLVAVQLVVRGRAGERKRAMRELSANQKAEVSAFVEQLSAQSEVDSLRRRFGIPDPSTWPAVSKESEPNAGIVEVVVTGPPVGQGPNKGHPVFRVPRRRTNLYGTYGAVVAVVGAFVSGKLGVSDGGVFAVFAVAWLGALAVGFRTRYFMCSDPDCEHELVLEDALCPRCSGTISGEIAEPDQRLEAEERLLEDRN